MVNITVYRIRIRNTLIVTGLLQQQVNRTGPDRHRTVTVLMFVLKSLCFFCHFPHRRTDVTVVTCVMFVMFFISLVHLKKTFKK